MTDPLGNFTTYAYDNLYRRVSITQPDPDAGGTLGAPVTSFSYDAAGNMNSLTDPVGNVTSWVYDAHNRVIEETNGLADTRYFEYDVAGNLVEKTDRNGLVTQFTYDNLYRLTQEVWLDGVNTVNTLAFTYDGASQMLTAADDFSSYAYTYNGLGQVTLIEIDNGGPLVELVQEFTPVGSRSLLAASFDDGGGMDDDFQNIFYYDNLQRMVQIDQSGQQGGNTVAEKRVNFAYNAAGQFTAIDRYKDLDGGSGNLVVETDFVYDGIGRLTDLTHVYDTTTIADYDWTFDAFSRVTSMSFSSLVGNDGSSAYDYDDTNQLIDADHDFQTDETYTYDENGNRTISGYTTGDNNLLTFDYEYDAEGNRVLKTNISTGDYVEYAWDHRNRLVSITQRDDLDAITHEVIYTYDIFNRRITKKIDADGAGGGGVETTQYIYDADDIILAFDGADALTNRYLHGPLVDQILADEDALNEVLWPLADNLGSIRDIVDSDGDVVNHLTYDAYGNITSETAPSVFHIYAYTGRERDEESEFYHNRNRYYAPLIGQWASEDPIGFVGNDLNIRRYTSNSPVTYTDPTGLILYDRSLKPFFDAYGYPHNWTGWIGDIATLPSPILDLPFQIDHPDGGEGEVIGAVAVPNTDRIVRDLDRIIDELLGPPLTPSQTGMQYPMSVIESRLGLRLDPEGLATARKSAQGCPEYPHNLGPSMPGAQGISTGALNRDRAAVESANQRRIDDMRIIDRLTLREYFLRFDDPVATAREVLEQVRATRANFRDEFLDPRRMFEAILGNEDN